MSDAITERTEDEVTVMWPSSKIGVRFSGFHDSTREGPYAEIAIHNLETDLDGHPCLDGLLKRARLALLGARSQDPLVKALLLTDQGVDWGYLVESSCNRAVDAFRTVTPGVDLADVEAPAQRPWLIGRLLPKDESTMIYADGECVGGETMLQGPDGDFRIADLARWQARALVWTAGPQGVTVARAGVPFVKGRARLYEFLLASGQRVVATMGHRFLTPDGWQEGRDLRPGCLIAAAMPEGAVQLPVSALSRQRSTQGNGLARSLADDRHSEQTVLDSLARCAPCCHRCGLPLPSAIDSGLAAAPSPSDARAHSQGGSHTDAPASSEAHSRHDPVSDRPSSCDCVRGEPWQVDAVCRGVASHSIPHPENSPVPSPSQLAFVPPAPTRESGLSASLVLDVASQPPEVSPVLYFSPIGAIRFVREDVFYDVQVPPYANYLADGILHHNSGKSLLALAVSLSVVTGKTVLPGLPPVCTGSVVYLDWETNRVTHRRRLETLCRGLEMDVPRGIFYQPMYAPLNRVGPEVRALLRRRQATLAVVDSMGFAAEGDVMGPDGALGVFRALRGWGGTVLALHHMSKEEAGKEYGAAESYGSIYFRNSVRMSWELRSTQLPGGVRRMALYHRKDNDGERSELPIGLQLYRNMETQTTAIGTFQVSGDQTLAAHGGLTYLLQSTLRQHKGALTAKELAEITGLDGKRIADTLRHDSRFVRLVAGGGRGNEAQWGLAGREA